MSKIAKIALCALLVVALAIPALRTVHLKSAPLLPKSRVPYTKAALQLWRAQKVFSPAV